jgi:hypothetical protein
MLKFSAFSCLHFHARHSLYMQFARCCTCTPEKSQETKGQVSIYWRCHMRKVFHLFFNTPCPQISHTPQILRNKRYQNLYMNLLKYYVNMSSISVQNTQCFYIWILYSEFQATTTLYFPVSDNLLSWHPKSLLKNNLHQQCHVKEQYTK